MASINFGGLATGLDTATLITEMMRAERKPLERLERDKSYLTNRLDAFKTFEQKLKDLQAKFEALNSSNKVQAFKATAATEEFFSLSASGKTLPGTFNVEVKQLAQVQKSVSQGFASATEKNFGTGTLTIKDKDGATLAEIAYAGDSLTSLRDKINAANKGEDATGISASIINDGVTGYRLVLTGKDGQSSFEIDVNETDAGTSATPSFSTTQEARSAKIVVDGIAIESKNNIFDEAIPGVTLTLNKANAEGETTVVTAEADTKALKDKIQGIVTAYNEIVNFISKQSDASWGKDAAFRSVTRRLQDLLTSTVGGDGALRSLSQLGIETEKSGSLKLNSSTLDKLLAEDLESVEKLFVGGEGVDGLAQKFSTYLKGVTDFADGLYATRKKSTDSEIRRINQNIERQEARLEQRERTLRAQFDALETLVGSMNAQSNYLAQQIGMWNKG